MTDTPIKISRGLEANIPEDKIDGNIYFCTDTGNIYIDCMKENLLERVQISAATATNVAWDGVTGKPSTFTPATHTHTKSQITDFPTSMPASDVYSWAKASTKPSYAWGEITGKPSSFTPASHGHDAATTSSNGFMPSTDKAKLNKIAYAHYSTESGSSGGYYKIKINSTEAWMLCFTIRLYQGYRATDIQISGYNYGNSYWYSPAAVIIADSHGSSMDVIFGYDSAYNLWVAIPAGNYTGLDIFNVTNGYRQISTFENLFTITRVDSVTTQQQTITAYPPYRTNQTVANATYASSAYSATVATYDGLGNNIVYTYLPKSGGIMTGALTLAADPTEPLQAATKQYVDNLIGSILNGAS